MLGSNPARRSFFCNTSVLIRGVTGQWEVVGPWVRGVPAAGKLNRIFRPTGHARFSALQALWADHPGRRKWYNHGHTGHTVCGTPEIYMDKSTQQARVCSRQGHLYRVLICSAFLAILASCAFLILFHGEGGKPKRTRPKNT